MNPTQEQHNAIITQDRALVVEAGAGTGKTWVLVQRFIHLLQSNPNWPLDSILAVTFTEKAAREMRTRLRQAIEAKARQNPGDGHWQDHRLHLDRLNVSTIHSLCARILHENAIDANIDPRFQVLDEQAAAILKEEAIRQTLHILNEDNHPTLELLASLRVFDLQGEMESMLGKRGTLYPLFSELDQKENLLRRWQVGLEALRNAVWQQQLRQEPRLSEALETLPQILISDPNDLLIPNVLLGQQGCQLLTQGDIIQAATQWKQINLSGGKQANWGGKEALSDLKKLLRMLRDAAKALEKAGACQEIGPLDEMAAEHLHLWRSLWERLEESYRQIKEMQQGLDFDDLEILTNQLLQQIPRPDRLERFLESIHHFMVDEFQDTNLIQQQIVNVLAPLDQPGKLFIVGDAKQSIYRFRQAQVSIFNQTAQQVEAITGHPALPLSTSFRSHHRLVLAANHLFEQILSPLGDAYAPYESTPGPLRANRASHPDLSHPVEMLLLPAKDLPGDNISAEDARIWEAQWIAQRLLALKTAQFPVWDAHQGAYRPFNFGDAAVLFRATTQLPLYEAEYKRFGLPYLTVSGRGYYDRPEVQDLNALLSALLNSADDLNLAAALRSPLFSLSDETLYRLRWHTPDNSISAEPIPFRSALSCPPDNDQNELVRRAQLIFAELWSLTHRLDVWTLLRTALDWSGYEATLAIFDGQTGRQRSNVQKFLALARDSGETNLSVFLQRLRDLKAREAREGEALGREPESGSVQLMSIHAAKGLEYPVIVIADMGRQKRAGFGSPYLLHDPAFCLVCKVRDEMGDWQKPAGYAWGEWLYERMDEAERKRLLYVGCTRAADLLILSGQVGNRDTWLSEAMAVWGMEGDGPEEESLDFDGFAIQVFRPNTPPEMGERAGESDMVSPGVSTLPPLALPLPVQRQRLPIAVTHIEQMLAQDENERRSLRPAIWNHERTAQPKRAPGYLVGNMVHRALADWQCLEASQAEVLQVLENSARREGVFTDALVDAVRRSYQILMNLTKHALYRSIQQAQRRYHEIPFTQTISAGTLHGVIDLLYQDQHDDWHLLDWKTEWSPKAKIEENAQGHLMQMAAYVKAIQQSMGIHPSVSLCFMVPHVVIYPISTDVLANVDYTGFTKTMNATRNSIRYLKQ